MNNQPSAGAVKLACLNMDWQQVVLNGGPPCFHLSEDGRFCGRAQRWHSTDAPHKFVSLCALVVSQTDPLITALNKIAKPALGGKQQQYTAQAALQQWKDGKG